MQRECSRILQEVEKVIKGKEQEKQLILAAILAKGHILLDDIPGVGPARRKDLMRSFENIYKCNFTYFKTRYCGSWSICIYVCLE